MSESGLSPARDEEGALRRVESAWKANPAAPALASELIQAYSRQNEIDRAEAVLETFRTHGPPNALAQVASALPKRK